MVKSSNEATDGTAEVKVSVCVPTYHRPTALARALDRLLALDIPPGGYEVVVVDDGSPASDRIPELLSGRQQASRVPLRWHRQEENRGPAAARNVAWHMATGEWIAFTDDDCRPEPDWLIRLLEAAGSTTADVVTGATRPDPDRAHLMSEPFSRSVQVDAGDEYYRTCNIAYRRDLLDRLGGFDERFLKIGDDTDLGWRAVAAGATTAFAEKAVVTHDVVVGDWRSDLRSRRRWTDTVRVVAKHPDARRLAWKPYVFRRSHVPVMAVMACAPLAVPRRSRRTVLLVAAAVLAGDLARCRSRRAAVAQLQKRVADLYEIGLLARTSVRERTLLL